MFAKIVLRRSDTGPPITVGELAEALLFYQNIHIVLDYGSLNTFVEKLGMERFLSLLSRPNVSAVYCEETLATNTTGSGNVKYHSFIGFHISGTASGHPINDQRGLFEYILLQHGYSRSKARKLVDIFQKKVPVKKLNSDFFFPGGVVRAATDDLLDNKFVYEAIRRALIHQPGMENLLGPFAFEIFSGPKNFHIYTDLDFDAINEVRRVRHGISDPLTSAHLINEILMARADTALAAHYGGEFYTSDVTSEIVRLRYSELLRRMGIESIELNQLKEIVISDSRSIREVLDSGERSFDEFLTLLDKSQRFRDWIQGVGPDEKLVNAYLRDVTAEGWIRGLPAKTLRYVLSSLAGFVEPITGAATSAADTYLVEKILGGWRPSHFIKGRLKPFIELPPK